MGSALSSPRSATSPAAIRFELSDQEGDAASIVIRFDDGSGLSPITTAVGSPSLTGLPTNGGTIEVLWDFATDLGTTGFVDGLSLVLTVENGVSPAPLTGVEQGNDAPVIAGLAPAPVGLAEYALNTDLEFELSDSSDDAITVAVQFNDDAAGGFPEIGWEFARPAVTPTGQPTPLFVVPVALSQPGRYSFKWDTTFDLDGYDDLVRVRITPTDPFSIGPAIESEFRVDNNEAPRAVLDANFLNGVKDRGVLPLALTIFDDENDDVDVVVQWRRTGQPFPALPSEVDELRGLLHDPARAMERRALQIALEAPTSFHGRVSNHPDLGPNQIRLPELVTTAAGLAAPRFGLAGRSIAIERARNVFDDAPWTADVLAGAVQGVPVGSGRTAAFLDLGPSGWRLRELVVESGELVRDLAAGLGTPRCLTVDVTGSCYFVGSSAGLFRVRAIDGAVTAFHDTFFVDGPRGLAALSADDVVATGDDRIVRVDLASGTQVDLFDGLQQPFGVVVDPSRPRSVLFTEAGADRLRRFDLDARQVQPIALRTDPGDGIGVEPLPSPRGLGLSRSKALLYVACDSGAATSLRVVDLWSVRDFDGVADASAEPLVRELRADLPAGTVSAFAADVRTLVAPVPSLGQPAIAGGIAARLQVPTAEESAPGGPVDLPTQIVDLEGARPSGVFGAVWRVDVPLAAVGSSTGSAGLFLWDTSELPGVQYVQVRAVPLDADVGTEGTLTADTDLRSRYELRRTHAISASRERTAIADLDADGDLDLATVGIASDQVDIHFRRDDGGFDTTIVVVGSGTSPDGVAAADFDGDGLMDLVCLRDAGQDLVLLTQTTPGSFSTSSPSVDIGGSSFGSAIFTADLDRDGATDLVIAREFQLRIVFGTSGGGFEATSTTLSTIAYFQELLVTDLDRDGAPDIVALTSFGAGGGGVQVFRQVAARTFSEILNNNLLPPLAVAAADLDSDGDLDLAVATDSDFDGASSTFFPAEFLIFAQNASGLFDAPIEPLDEGRVFNDVEALDLDDDGDLDLVLVENDQGIAFLFQGESGSLAESDAAVTSGSSQSVLMTADLEGDGDLDFLSFDATNVRELLAIGVGSPPLASISATAPFDVAIGDLDGDGDMDYVTGGGVLTIHFQTASGVFVPTTLSIPSAESIRKVAIGDLDGDGDVDIAFTTLNTFDGLSLDDSIGVVVQTAAGIFELKFTFLSAALQTESLVTADVSGDGLVDIVSAGSGFFEFGVHIHTQLPSGFFDFAVLPVPGGAGVPLAAAVGDIDGDGDMDIAMTGSSANRVTLYDQGPIGTFTPRPGLVSVGANPIDILFEDLDGDGDIDFVTVDRNDDRLTLVFQDQSGNFVPSPDRPVTGDSPTGVVALDHDGDGDLDLAVVCSGSSELVICLQTAPGNFMASAVRIPVAASTRALDAGDLDGDGDTDLLASEPVQSGN